MEPNEDEKQPKDELSDEQVKPQQEAAEKDVAGNPDEDYQPGASVAHSSH